jgi:beta-glucosidase-like glycosyl hydrolase
MLAILIGKSENAVMKTRSLQEEVAQMVMPRIDGPKLGDPTYRERAETLVREGIGGFILFGGDIEQTPRYLQMLQSMAAVPLLIASDVERGLGQQLAGGTNFPSQRAVAAAVNRRSKKDVELLDKMLDAVRQETRAAGIHAVFSPVVDVNNNPDNPIICTRAFGEEPEIVEWFGSRYIRGLQKRAGQGRADLLACAKHFPGHGDTDQDSHSVLPEIRADKQRLNRVELPPFREAVKDGVGMVMVAHLLVPALDPAAPTTFSKKTITDLLREGMGFDGLIVSDALDMGALAGRYSPEEIAVRAVEAGMDILLHPNDARMTIDAVIAAVEQGRLTRQRIAESAERIMHAKRKLGLFDKDRHAPAPIEYEQHRLTSREIGRRALRIVSGSRKNILPVRHGAGVACFILDDDNNHESANVFIREIKGRFTHLSLLVLTPDAEMPVSLVNDCIRASGFVVMAFYSRISASKGKSGISDKLFGMAVDVLRTAKAAKTHSAIISFDSPYILDLFGDADVRVAAYDRMEDIQKAAADLLAGNKDEDFSLRA